MEESNSNEMKMYCLRCKKKSDVKDVEIKTSKNKRLYKQGLCVACDTRVNQFLKSVKAPIEKLLNEKEDDK